MYANATVETGTGTGDTITLSGAVSGRIPFSASFADGDLVAYFIEDSGGSIMVAGVGTYNSPANTITRNDSWNYNGTVVDDTPSSNIALSSGSHVIRCDVTRAGLHNSARATRSGAYYFDPHMHERNGTLGISATQRRYATPITLPVSGEYDAFVFEVTTANASCNIRLGIYDVGDDGFPNKLIAVHNTATTLSATGVQVFSFDGGSTFIPKGDYYIVFHHSDSFSLQMAQTDSSGHRFCGSGAVENCVVRFQDGNDTAYTTLPDNLNGANTWNGLTSNYLVMGLRAT